MSSRKRGRQQAVAQRQVRNQGGTRQAGNAANIVRLIMDSYSNPVARLGVGQDSVVEASQYPITRLTQNYALMNSLYRNEWIARRIIDTIPEDMCKNWYHITSQVDPDSLDALKRVERVTKLKTRIMEGLRWGRLYGGAAGVIMVEGQEDMLSEPLDLDMIMPGQFTGLIIADRWSGVYPSVEIVEDLSDPDYGQPEYYTFSMDRSQLTAGIRVHHSRVIPFLGRDLPYIEKLAESYWGMAELEHVYTELNKRNAVSANLAQMVFQANLRVLKMADLGEALVTTTPQNQKDLYNVIAAQNLLMTSMGIQVMDREDSMESHTYSFSGLPELYELFLLDVSGASELPATKLFGRSPQGMNSTGESDLTNYYDSIHQKQESQLRPILDKVLPVVCMSAWGAIPDDLEYEFDSIRDSSDQERANLVQQTAAAITSVYQAGIISQKTALKELRSTESMTGMWSTIDDADVDAADDGTQNTAGAEGFPVDPETPPTQEGGNTDEQEQNPV